MELLTKLLIPGGLAFIMFAMGLALTLDDFRRVAVAPKAVAGGLVAQLLLLPAVGILLVTLWPLSPELAVGVIILAACPGGITSNLLTHLARGDTALSITLTAICSVAGLVTVPLIVGIGLELFLGDAASTEIRIGGITLGVLLISGVPLALGMVLRWWRPAWSARAEPPARKGATAIFAVIVLAAFWTTWPAMMANLESVGGVVALLNVTTMALGFGLGVLLGLPGRQRVAIGLECGLQNAAIGIFVAATLLDNATMMIPSMMYAVVMNVTALLVLGWALSGGLGQSGARA
jgi:BASS family bile acid:Na+ symporter